jgi:hypothetical protein
MNMYEKMFFENGGKDMQLIGGKSLKGESALISVDHNDTITNYFNKEPYKQQEETLKSMKGGIPIFERSPESLRKSRAYEINDDNNAYTTNIEIPTIKNKIKKENLNYNYGADLNDKSSIKADDTLDFIDKINGVGKSKDSKDSNGMKFGRQNSLSKKAQELKSNRLNDSGYKMGNHMAGKLDLDDFPALPDYEGIQSKFMAGKEGNSDRKFENNYAEPLNTSMISDKTVPFKLTGMGKMRESTMSLANGTTNTLKTINSINLEKINNRNENRLEEMERKYNFGRDYSSPSLENSYSSPYKGKDIDYGYDDSGFGEDDKLKSIKEERWEETFKKL